MRNISHYKGQVHLILIYCILVSFCSCKMLQTYSILHNAFNCKRYETKFVNHFSAKQKDGKISS